MNNYICSHCNKCFASIMSLTGHKRMHGISNGTTTNLMCCCIITKKEMQVRHLKKYQLNLVNCKQCNKPFDAKEKTQLFCSHSCSATHNNTLRGPMSEETKDKIRNSASKKISKRTKKIEVVGLYSKIFLCKCRHCKITFISRIKKQYCEDHRSIYSESSKSGFKFTFNVYHYPALFNLASLTEVGWFSPGGKAGKWNPNGLSRDHKISVNDAIKNNYNPYYITHPLNCEIMPHSQNNKKKTNSSLTYSELIDIVDKFELEKSSKLAGLASNQQCNEASD